MYEYVYAHIPMGSILKLLIEDQKQKPDNDRIDREAELYLELGAGTYKEPDGKCQSLLCPKNPPVVLFQVI